MLRIRWSSGGVRFRSAGGAEFGDEGECRNRIWEARFQKGLVGECYILMFV